MAASTAYAARSGWSLSAGIRWSVSCGISGQFAPESGGQYQRILQYEDDKVFITSIIGKHYTKDYLAITIVLVEKDRYELE